MNETKTQETKLAADLETAAEKAKYDAACRQLLSEKVILAWIMKSTMDEFKGCSIDEICRECIIGTPKVASVPVHPDETVTSKISQTGVEDVTMTEGKIVYDIRFYAKKPKKKQEETEQPVENEDLLYLIINIEAQNSFRPGYPLIKRAIYYCSRMISSQYETEFKESQYGKIKKVYSVWICTNVPKYCQNTITAYRIAERNMVGNVKETKENYDLMTAVMIGLGPSEDAEDRSLLKLLDVLLAAEPDTQKKKDALEQEFEIPMTETLEGRMEHMCNLSEGVWEKAMEKGIERGLERGREEGLEKGREETCLSSIQNVMSGLGMTAEQAMELLKIPVEEWGKYLELLRQCEV